MNADELLRHYERIADAPQAVARLRRFVLDLAVRGKLVPQDVAEWPSSPALDQVAATTFAPQRTTYALVGAPPYELPDGWAWVAFGNLHTLIRGVTYSKGDVADGPGAGFVPVLRANNIGATLTHDDPVFVKADCVATNQFLRRGDYMIALSSGSKSLVGKAAFVPEDFNEAFGGFCGVIRLHDSRLQAFVGNFLRSDFYRDSLAAGSRGIGINNLKKETISNLHFPMPPFAEQHRIVAKVDELMTLCDRLQAARAQREAARERLARSCLVRLDTPDPETFREDARFALDALPALTARPDQIKQLRQTILNLAVRGKLSDHSDWATRSIRLGNVASLQNGYAFKSEWFSTSGIRLLRNANVSHGTLDWSEQVRLPESRVDEYERFRLHLGDVVLSLDRPFIATGTKVARVSRDDLPALLLQRVGRFVLSEDLHPDYLYFWITSQHFVEQIDPGRSNGVPHISSKQVENAAIFVPPLPEQHRIVAKIDELIALCDRLEASLTQADEHRRRLLEALLHQALESAASLEEQAA